MTDDDDDILAPSEPAPADAFVEAINKLSNEKAELQKQVADLTQKLKYAEDRVKSANESSAELRIELEQLHLLLDALPGAAPRLSESDSGNSWDRKEHKAMTRLAAYLAARS